MRDTQVGKVVIEEVCDLRINGLLCVTVRSPPVHVVASVTRPEDDVVKVLVDKGSWIVLGVKLKGQHYLARVRIVGHVDDV